MTSADSTIRYKVAIVGAGGVGKTTLLRRYATGKFQESRIMTIGVDFQTIEVDLKGQPIKLTVWDLAGQERFASFRDSFYKGARAVALVFDVHDRGSLDDLPHWLEETQRVVPDAYDPKKRADAEEKQLAQLAETKKGRDNSAVEATLARLEDAAKEESANIIPPLIECVKAYATVGEMTSTLKKVFGEHQGYASL